MGVAFERWAWTRHPSVTLLRLRRRGRGRIKAEDRSRYIWQAIWLLLAFLAACLLGAYLGFHYSD
jgi:hypothetical protein